MTSNQYPVIEGSKGKGGGAGASAKEAPNTLASVATVRIQEVLSEGEIVGLSTGDAKSIFFDNTPLLNEDGTLNFENVKYDIRYGLPSQTVMPGFSTVETEQFVGTEVKFATSVTRTVSLASRGARITIQFPEGLTEQNITNGDLNGSSVQLKIEKKLTSSGTWTVDQTFTVTGKTISAYEMTPTRIERPTGSGMWDIRVSRLTADPTSAAIRNKTIWARFTEIIDSEETYDNTALAGLQVDAESTGGSIPVRSYLIKGIKCRVPNNRDPDTHTYNGQWNGTFVTEWTDNPAWILYDILTNKRYGMGEFITSSMIDLYSFYDAGVYCDTMVPDGNGGLEPRFTFNGVIQARDDAIKVLQAVASSMRSTLYYYGSLLRINQDREGSPVQRISKKDVIDGKFTYQSSSLIQRSTVCYVTFNDKNDKWLPRIVQVENTNGIQIYGYNPLEVSAFGCTSEGQAHRLGTWTVYTNLNQRESCTWKASFNQQTLIIGDIVTIHDDDYGVERDFRIMSIRLEEPNIVTMEAVLYDGVKYQFVDLTDNSSPPVFGPPGGSTVSAVTNIAWTPTEVNFNNVITYNLQLEWKPSVTGNATRYNVDWRKDNGNFISVEATSPAITITNVTPGTFEARITAFNSAGVFSPVAPSTYAYTIPGTGTTPPPTPGTSAIGTPTNLKLTGGLIQWMTEDLSFQWDAPNPIGPPSFKGSLKDFELKIINPLTSIVLRTVYVNAVVAGATQTFIYTKAMNLSDGGPYRSIKVEIRCRDTKNITGAAATQTWTNAAITQLSNLIITAKIDGFFITYTMPTDIDYAGTYVWASTTPLNVNNLSSANLVVDGRGNFLVWTPTTALIPNTTYYFAVAAYDWISKPVNGSGLNIKFATAQSSFDIPVGSGSVLPTTGNFEGRLFYNTTDGKLYRYHLGAWTAAVPTVDIIGTLSAAQLGDIAAAIANGSITETKIAADSISTPLLKAGAVSAAKIAAGAVVANTIAANAVTAIALASDSVTANKIAANSITSDKIVANAITAGKVDVGVFTADQAFTNTVTSRIVVANSFIVDAGRINNLNVNTFQIQDNAVTIPIGYGDGTWRQLTNGWTDVWGAYINNDTGKIMYAHAAAVLEFHAGDNPGIARNFNRVNIRVLEGGTPTGNNQNVAYIMGIPYQALVYEGRIAISPGTRYLVFQAQEVLDNPGSGSYNYGVVRNTNAHIIGLKK